MSRRAFLVPEIIQTSLMDCGPAALAAVLEGFGIAADYDDLRERCQTQVDGTSIDALAKLGSELGLRTNEVLVARDTLLLPEQDALPAIVLTRVPGGLLHFVVVWRVVGPLVQILDPSGGRSWATKEALLARIADVPLPLSAKRFRKWMASAPALRLLRARMRELGLRASAQAERLATAEADPTFETFAALDAGIRMVRALVRSGAVRTGTEAAALLASVVAKPAGIPKKFWWATARGPEMLSLEGTVVVHFSKPDAPAKAAGTTKVEGAPLRKETSPLWLLARSLKAAGLGVLGWTAAALVASAVVATLDVFILRGILDLHRMLALDYQRAMGLGLVALFAALALGLELLTTRLVQSIGLGLEVRLRAALMAKLPRLGDAYMQSRPTSDMASRGHSLHALREAPLVVARGLRALLALTSATACVAWLSPASAGLAVLAATVAVVLPYALRGIPAETAGRFRTQATALDRFYLDALRGVVPIRVHGAERAVAREHEALLATWVRTGRALAQQSVGIQAAQAALATALAAAMVYRFAGAETALAGVLLFAFWALRIPAAGQDFALSMAAWRDVRVTLARLLSPLSAPEAIAPRAAVSIEATSAAPEPKAGGVKVELQGVSAMAGGHTILDRVDLRIEPGSHVGIVGLSGAGKSSLLGLLQGFLGVSGGELRVDDQPLDAAGIARLHDQTAWVDPSVFLWNRTLLENVCYGAGKDEVRDVSEALRSSNLTEVLEHLPEGMRAELGEGGACVSGGQGQRVRLARAWLRKGARLALLDEPFRGLEREQRRELLARARRHFQGATLLYVSHDVNDTAGMDRVLVVAHVE
ncbi:MAG: ATP-binding cassette domain-containing protein, partial [Polyangiaceae bacterium]|nr:ATP-binding cassette domain-containing protein [Polyangiaceae bacterium]